MLRPLLIVEGVTMAKVLVIDDAPNVRTLLDMLLRQQRYDVVSPTTVGRAYSFIVKNTRMSFFLI